jgi:hypothetical protein
MIVKKFRNKNNNLELQDKLLTQDPLHKSVGLVSSSFVHLDYQYCNIKTTFSYSVYIMNYFRNLEE